VAQIEAPGYDSRLLLLGTSGSGKTRLLRELLAAGYERWIAIDAKGDFWPKGRDYRLLSRPPWEDPKAWGSDRILYRPATADTRKGASLDAVLRWIYERQRARYDDRRRRPGPGLILAVEEAFMLSRSGHTQALSDAAVSGRGLNLGLWVASQRPRWIPVEVRSESDRWFVFPLGYEEDEREVLRYAKGALDLDDLQEAGTAHSFWELVRKMGSSKVRAIWRPPLDIRET